MRIIVFFIPLFLFASVKKEIINFYKKHYPAIKIEKITSNRPFPEKYKHISFKLANYKLPSSTLIIDGKYYFYTIKAKIKVFTARKIIRVNEPIKPNVTLKLINFRTFYSKPLDKIPENLIASKIISKNSVINESNTKIRPLILKGETVNVVFENKNIEIFSKGEALNDANANETVKVKINAKTYTGIANKTKEVVVK
ncbi:flagellar basal body P-ring formation chaperone FlgA [Nautilia sp.]